MQRPEKGVRGPTLSISLLVLSGAPPEPGARLVPHKPQQSSCFSSPSAGVMITLGFPHGSRVLYSKCSHTAFQSTEEKSRSWGCDKVQFFFGHVQPAS